MRKILYTFFKDVEIVPWLQMFRLCLSLVCEAFGSMDGGVWSKRFALRMLVSDAVKLGAGLISDELFISLAT